MKTHVLVMMAGLLFVCGCTGSERVDSSSREATSVSPVIAGEPTSFGLELRVEKAKAEQLGFAFPKMAAYFAAALRSKHPYGTKYVGDTFVVGMNETPERMSEILQLVLTTDRGAKVRLSDLCTVHDLRK